MSGKFALFIAFAFTVMADPVSSVAYAIQAALQELDGDLSDFSPPWPWSWRRSPSSPPPTTN